MSAYRAAPHAEWVHMYRLGLSASVIAKLVGAAESTVRYHLQLAAAAEPGLRDAHASSTRSNPPTRVTAHGLANLADVVALYGSEGRLPSTRSADRRERSLAVWLVRRRRQDYDADRLATEYREGLSAVPGWENRTRETRDEEQWLTRLATLISYMQSGRDWPRHKSPDDGEERLLGVWIQYQRTKTAAGQLAPQKVQELDTLLPGWRDGRRGSGNSKST